MVPVSATTEFLLADARLALRKIVSGDGRTELSRAFTAWLLHGTEAQTDAEFATLVREAAAREGAQQDFQTVAILGFGASAGILRLEHIDVLKKGIRRQAGRGVVIDELPAAFCSDAVGVLGVVLGTKASSDAELTEQVLKWTSKFLRKSYDRERTEEWQRCLFAAADLQLGGSVNLAVPKSPGVADVRTALVAKGIIESGGAEQADDDDQRTLTLAIRELPDKLSCDRAVLRLAAVESVILEAKPMPRERNMTRIRKRDQDLSTRDRRVHDAVGAECFRILTNAEIMTDPSIRKRLAVDFQLKRGGEDTKRCFDRIRTAQGYPLSSEIKKKRAKPQ
jgi:hypothetical protein